MSDDNVLMYKIRKDANLRKYLNNDFIGSENTTSHLFSQVFNAESQLWGEVLQLYINEVRPDHRELLQLYSQKIPVRDIAVKLNTTPRSVTIHLNKLKTKLMKRFKEDLKQDSLLSLINLKDYSVKLDSLPQYVADKVHTIRYLDEEKHVYRVNRDGETFWVDEHGVAYSKEIQEILDDLPELKMEVLDVD